MTHKAKQQYDFTAKVFAERARQDKQWGGPAHDDDHTYADWLRYIRHQVTSIMVVSARDEELDAAMRDPLNLHAFEERMVKVAALAMAAVESLKRKSGR